MIKFSKIRDVKSPSRGTSKSAGIDLFIPVFNEKFWKDFYEENKKVGHYFKENEKDFIIIPPHEECLIPSGIKVNIEENRILFAANKSGIASKKGVIKLAEIVDEDFQGEIIITLKNTTEDFVKLEQNQKIIQLVEIPVYYSEVVEVNIENLYEKKSERGEGRFGSTGS